MEIVQSLLSKMGIFHKPQIKALTTLFATILIACGKVNFSNLSRYSQRTERSYRRQFKKQFDFAQFNSEVIKAATSLHHSMIAVMDCSFIAKSGKKTFGLDRMALRKGKIVEAAGVQRSGGAGEKEEVLSIAFGYFETPLCPPAPLQSLRCIPFSLT